jgi:protein arginine N-methyltransferase 2
MEENDEMEIIREPTENDKALLVAVGQGNVAEVRRLLKEDADVWYKDDHGRTPLHIAARIGNREIIDLLLENGAPWNALDIQERTVGDYAKECANPDIYEILINAGCRAEMILGCVLRKNPRKISNEDYLKQKLVYDGERLIDAEGHGVMMGWESPLMSLHAEIICNPSGNQNTENSRIHSSQSPKNNTHGDILNIGFGLGIIDTAIQTYQPRSHTIIEAHPDVYAHMVKTGWTSKPGVTVIYGRWQDVLDQLKTYDGIFFDTYGEYYEDMQDFHEELENLLKPGGCYSFFNGLVATQPFFS